MSDPLTLIVIGIVILLALSAFFSGSETALTGASRPRMHLLESEGNRRAGTVNLLHAQQERLIGGILIGNNIVNILASALATSVMISLFGDAGVAYATIAMTTLVVIFSEVLPKTYAIRHADDVAIAVARPIRFVVIALSPLSRAIEAVVGVLLRLLGEKISSEGDAAREQELRGAIRMHADTNTVSAHEGLMLGGVMDLDDVEVGEIMTHRKDVLAIAAGVAPDSIIDQILESPYTRLPLWSGSPDNIVGILHAKALLREVRAQNGDVSGLDIVKIAAEPWFIPGSTTALDQLQAFRERREHFALVVDEYGSLMGIVTLEDVLEEIVGEIADEHDVAVAGVRLGQDGSVIVRGAVTIRDLNRQFGWSLPDEEAATIAGLVMYEARSIPEAGQVFHFHSFRFEILRRVRNQITSIRVTPPVPPDTEE